MHLILSEDCGYAHSHHLDTAGVSILSRWPLVEARNFEFACAALIKAPGHTLLAANVHLPWKSERRVFFARSKEVFPCTAPISA